MRVKNLTILKCKENVRKLFRKRIDDVVYR